MAPRWSTVKGRSRTCAWSSCVMKVCGESSLLRLSLPVILSLMLWYRAFSRVVVVGLGRTSVGSSGLAGMVTSTARYFAGRGRVG